MKKDITKYFVRPESVIYEVIEVINNNKSGIALVVDGSGLLLGTITDGDIRRAMLSKCSFDDSCSTIMFANPTIAQAGASNEELQLLMKKHSLRHIPLVDDKGIVQNIIDIKDLIDHNGNIVAVVMAGGEGRRLRPITESIPKPMIEVGRKPILERIIENLSASGIKQVYLAVNYKSNIIEDYFGNGEKHGVAITYIREKEKLGTAGALSLIEDTFADPIIVMNGDVLTEIKFNRLLDFHRHHRSVMTLAVKEYNLNIPYGVLNLAGHYVLGIEEKPSKKFLCNAGIYVIEPELFRFIPAGREFHMTDLLNGVIKEGLPVGAFPVHEYWVDIGKNEELQKVRNDFLNLDNGKD